MFAANSFIAGIIIVLLGALPLGAYSLFQFVLTIIAIFKAKSGEWYLFPMTWHLLKA
jgi:uncharacterized Tic20 family protein